MRNGNYQLLMVQVQGVHLSFKANSPMDYWDYQIQPPTIMYHAIKNMTTNDYNYEFV